MRSVVIVAGLAVLLPLAQAQPKAPPLSARRARACVAATKDRSLTNAQYRSFIQMCLASKRPPQELFETASAIERRCNTIADARQLTGQTRIEFMQSCRRKGN